MSRVMLSKLYNTSVQLLIKLAPRTVERNPLEHVAISLSRWIFGKSALIWKTNYSRPTLDVSAKWIMWTPPGPRRTKSKRLQILLDYSFHPEYSQPSSSARFLKSDSPGGRHCWHVFLPKFVSYLWHSGQFVDDSIFKGAVFYKFVLKYIIDIKWATGTNTWKLQDIVSCFCFLGLERWVDPFLSVRNVSSNSRCTYFQNHIRVESVPHWPVSDIWQAPHLDEGQSCQYIHVVLHLRSIHSHFITFMVNTLTYHYIYGQYIHIILHLWSIHSHLW